jgi:NADH-quinone oxidoreductase subunit N
MAGFFAKWFVFSAAVSAGLYWLAVLGLLASVVGAYYYLRIVKIMFFDDTVGTFEPMPVALSVILAVTTAVNLLFGLWPSLIAGPAEAAARSLF